MDWNQGLGLEINIRQHNYQYDNLSKQGSNQCNNGWQAVEATALAAVTAGVSNKTRQNIMWSLGCCCECPGCGVLVIRGVLLSPHGEGWYTWGSLWHFKFYQMWWKMIVSTADLQAEIDYYKQMQLFIWTVNSPRGINQLDCGDIRQLQTHSGWLFILGKSVFCYTDW